MSIGGCEVSQHSCHDVKLSGGATSLSGISVQHRQRAGEPLGFSKLLFGTIEGTPRKAMGVQSGTKVKPETKSEIKTCGLLAPVCPVQGKLLAFRGLRWTHNL